MTGTTLTSEAASQQGPPVVHSRAESQTAEVATGDASELANRKARWRDDPRVPACLISTILHTIILIVLALFTYREGQGLRRSLTARQGAADSSLTLQAIEPLNESSMNEVSSVDQPVNVTITTAAPAEIVSPLRPAPAETKAQLPVLETAVLGSASSIRLPGSGGLDRRTPEGRKEFGKRYGATDESEEAVEAALAYLAAHQRDNGSWSFNLNLAPCNGQCRNSKKGGGDTPTPSTGATGLALLAFLGAGHTHHREGPYQETVRRGIYYLRSVAAEAEAGYDWQQGSMYGHGIALMALAEALTMTRDGDRYDSDLLSLVQQGASFTSVAQHRSGSWGYVPGSPGDTTVTGWQVLSLIAAKKGGATLHTNTLSDAKLFVMSTCTDRDYWFGYKGPPGEPTTTAIALTLLQYLGASPHDTPFYMALTKMAQRGPTRTNIYHDYYATLALHHSRHWAWEEWNQRLRDHLVSSQVKSGHEKGSWHFADRWGDVGGRLYTTAMCAMTLEIYYRYMPLYESSDEFPL